MQQQDLKTSYFNRVNSNRQSIVKNENNAWSTNGTDTAAAVS